MEPKKFPRTRRFFSRIKGSRIRKHYAHLSRDPEVRKAAKDLGVLVGSYYLLKKMPSLRGRVLRRRQVREAKAAAMVAQATAAKTRKYYQSTLGGYNAGYKKWKSK